LYCCLIRVKDRQNRDYPESLQHLLDALQDRVKSGIGRVVLTMKSYEIGTFVDVLANLRGHVAQSFRHLIALHARGQSTNLFEACCAFHQLRDSFDEAILPLAYMARRIESDILVPLTDQKLRAALSIIDQHINIPGTCARHRLAANSPSITHLEDVAKTIADLTDPSLSDYKLVAREAFSHFSELFCLQQASQVTHAVLAAQGRVLTACLSCPPCPTKALLCLLLQWSPKATPRWSCSSRWCH
jgi:hypothetical protein